MGVWVSGHIRVPHSARQPVRPMLLQRVLTRPHIPLKAVDRLFMIFLFGGRMCGGYCVRHDPSGLRELPWFAPPESELAVGPCAVVCAHASGMIRLARELLH